MASMATATSFGTMEIIEMVSDRDSPTVIEKDTVVSAGGADETMIGGIAVTTTGDDAMMMTGIGTDAAIVPGGTEN